MHEKVSLDAYDLEHVNIIKQFETISKRESFSELKLQSIRNDLSKNLSSVPGSEHIAVITTGSYGRREASDESDMDLFVIFDDEEIEACPEIICEKIEAVLSEHNIKDPGSTATFGAGSSQAKSELLTNLGGENDDNKHLTRRMLFLLESDYLFNEQKFLSLKKELIGIYIKTNTPNHNISRFLLNDMIRYYRTITTDFEFKVAEQGKEWGLRNIKLRFSRKLLFFSGVMVIAENCYKTRDEKISSAVKLFKLTPIQRICLLSSVPPKKALYTYDKFLEKISDPGIRRSLESVDKEEREDHEEFCSLKNLSQHFSWELSICLKNTYDASHPIHHSLIF